MCGRFSLSKSKDEVAKRFQVKVPSDYRPRFNVAPMQMMPVITCEQPNEVQYFKWGLVPSWSLDTSTAANMINARAETITTKIPFKHCVKSQRCLIPADGFFEWKKEGKAKIPYRFTLNSDEVFAFAGLYDAWENQDSGEKLHTFTILTTEANLLMKDISDRMPVILRKDLEKLWIADKISDSQMNSLLRPLEADMMSSYKAHRSVNSVQNDTPECIQAAPNIYPGETFSLFG